MINLFTLPNDQADIFVFFVSWVILVLCSCLVFLIGGYFINTTSLKKRVGNGLVIYKNFTPAHYETNLVQNNSTGLTDVLMVFRPDAWRMEIAIDGRSDLVDVSQNVYEKTELLSTVSVTYSIGRIWKFLFIHTVNA